MARRRESEPTRQQPADTDPQGTVVDDSAVGAGAGTPSPVGGQVIEDAPGLAAADAPAPTGDPGDLSSFGRGPGLPDLGIGDESAVDLDDPGGLGSTLFDDLGAGTDVPDPTDGVGGAGDGWSPPDIADESGWAAATDKGTRIDEGTSGAEYHEASEDAYDAAVEAFEEGDDIWGSFLMEVGAAAEEAADERFAQEALQSREWEPWDYDDDEPSGEDSPGDSPSGSETMPIPDDFGSDGGGALDAVITGDVDPAPEVEAAGDGGGLDAVITGDVDPDPELEDAGGSEVLDMERAGLGAVDPVGEGSTLLGSDTGDVAEMAEAGDLGGDVELDLDDSLTEVDLGEDV
jgi:hypothetical protein